MAEVKEATPITALMQPAEIAFITAGRSHMVKILSTAIANHQATLNVQPPGLKPAALDAVMKDQIMWVLLKMVNAVAHCEAAKAPPIDDARPLSSVCAAVDAASVAYQVCGYVDGASFKCEASEEDEDLALTIIGDALADEDLKMSVAAIIVSFVRRVGMAMSNMGWKAPKKVAAEVANGLLRVIDTRGTNPTLFAKMYDAALWLKVNAPAKKKRAA